MANDKEPKAWGWTSPQVIITLLLLAGFGVLVVVMVRSVEEADPQWSRLLYVFGSIEALVFGAVGAMLGVQISRSQVDAANDQAERSADRADRSDEEARNSAAEAQEASTLKAAIAAKAQLVGAVQPADYEDDDSNWGGPSFDRITGIPQQPSDARSQLAELVLLVRELESRRHRSDPPNN